MPFAFTRQELVRLARMGAMFPVLSAREALFIKPPFSCDKSIGALLRFRTGHANNFNGPEYIILIPTSILEKVGLEHVQSRLEDGREYDSRLCGPRATDDSSL